MNWTCQLHGLVNASYNQVLALKKEGKKGGGGGGGGYPTNTWCRSGVASAKCCGTVCVVGISHWRNQDWSQNLG